KKPEPQDPLYCSEIPAKQSRGQQALGAARTKQCPGERPKDLLDRVPRARTRHLVLAVPRPEHDARTILDPLLPEECAWCRLQPVMDNRAVAGDDLRSLSLRAPGEVGLLGPTRV